MINAASCELWRLAVSLKLTAWQRSGIVISVIWILGVAGYAGYILYNEKQDDALHGRLAEFRSECEQSVKDPLNQKQNSTPRFQLGSGVLMKRGGDLLKICLQ